MTTPSLVLAAACGKVASLATARDATKNFKLHDTGLPFASSPAAKKEAFEIVFRDTEFTNAFGLPRVRETLVRMVVRLGTPPYTIEQDREKWLQADILRIADALEDKSWFITDVQSCFLQPQGTDIDKTNPNWWLTEIYFDLTFLQDFPS